jgi:peroxiredoxin
MSSRTSRAGEAARAWLSFVTLALLLVSVAVNLFQAQKLGAFPARDGRSPRLGAPVAPLSARTLDGRRVEIAFQGKPTILYYFSPTCEWCERNWLNVKALAVATEGRYRFVGISTTRDIAAWATERGLTFELVAEPDADAVRALDLGGTPQTLLISASGALERHWRGAYTPAIQAAVERTFDAVLPGLRPPAAGTR